MKEKPATNKQVANYDLLNHKTEETKILDPCET